MSELPLEGLTVLDLSRLLPGPFCSLLLADFGADVIKVEDTGMGDYIRWAPPHYEGAAGDWPRGALFLALNRGKRSIRIDLKTEQGKDVLLRLVEQHDADVLVESFRPGVLDRLGVGYERLREVNPALVYCAITGYGQDGPYTQRAGHDMNYLGLVGLLGLTGARDGPPVQSAGQIADIGGGALMAVIGIMFALRERERSGEGQLVDCSMFDGSLSWLAMVAADAFATGEVPRRGELQLAGGLSATARTSASRRVRDARRARAEVLAGLVRGRRAARPDLEVQFEAPGSEAHESRSARSSASARASNGARSPTSTTAASSRFSSSTRRSTPSWSRAREMIVDDAPARARAAGQAARRADQARPHPGPAGAGARAGARRAHRGGAARGQGSVTPRSRRCSRPAPSRARVSRRASRSWAAEMAATGGRLKMSELAERSGVSAGTIKHYLREGLLGDDEGVMRTSRNMAYYPPEFIERIQLIKRLQEDRYMPLRVIRDVIAEDPERGRADGRARGPDPRAGDRGRRVAPARQRQLGAHDL